MTSDILLVHQDSELLSHFQKEFEKNGTIITSSKTAKVLSKRGSPPTLVVIDTEGDWVEGVESLQKMKKEGKDFYTILSSSTMLKKTIPQICETALRLHHKGDPSKEQKGQGPNLTELIEKKLAEFVRKTKHGAGKNLYRLLIEEFEKPLIAIALQETRGNQIQAAQLLGMNRNTLRKKIKEFKISIVKREKR